MAPSDAPGGPARTVIRPGDTAGVSRITINGVVLKAHQIDFSRKVDEVRLSGSAEIVGGKLPDKLPLAVYIEGVRVGQ